MIPGLDMLRLFLSRIINKKNPFFGDLNHFHHLLIKKFTLKISLFIYMTIIIWPHLLRNFLDVKILIILNTLMYTLCVLFLKKLKKFS